MKDIISGSSIKTPAKEFDSLRRDLEKKDVTEEFLLLALKPAKQAIKNLYFNKQIKSLVRKLQGNATCWNQLKDDEILFLEETTQELKDLHDNLEAPISALNEFLSLAHLLKRKEFDVGNARFSLNKFLNEKYTPSLRKIDNHIERLRQVYLSAILRLRGFQNDYFWLERLCNLRMNNPFALIE